MKKKHRLTDRQRYFIKKLSSNKILALIIIVFEYDGMDPELDKSNDPCKKATERGLVENIVRKGFIFLIRKKLNKLILEWMRADKNFEKNFNLFVHNSKNMPAREIYRTLKNKGTKAKRHV